ncbi:hypothetical protein [Tenacibaculum soleae]|uniref:hypothetical protein n=1 Tax=Tenacibaculum soleae TaxID=447689 RepID=UPI002300D94F|nr:hypothetical protein [Tenacibaculum soleae]
MQAFKNLAALKTVQKEAKEILGAEYSNTIQPFVDILTKVMEANSINEFEALKLIKDETEIYKKEHAPMFFSAALIEITEVKNFSGLER